MQTTINLEQLVATVGDAIIVADTEGKITLWNPAAERIFGFAEDEAIGKSLDLIIPQRLQARHWEGYENTMLTGHMRYGNDVLIVPAAHKDGRALSIAFTVALLYAATGQLSGIVAVVRDETSRFQEERNLRAACRTGGSRRRLTSLAAASSCYRRGGRAGDLREIKRNKGYEMRVEILGPYKLELSAMQLIENCGWAPYAAISRVEDEVETQANLQPYQHVVNDTVFESEAAALAAAQRFAIALVGAANTSA